MTTVLFLGAGASMDAGYPATSSLLSEMARSFRNTPFVQDKKNWAEFESFKKNTHGVVGQILNSSNPELVLTLPDLVEATRQYADDETTPNMIRARRSGDEKRLLSVANWWKSRARNELHDVQSIKLPFQRVAQSFFLAKHGDDANDESRSRRDYIAKALFSLTERDVVITTNWDTLAERTLMDADKWSLSDGYGFSVDLRLKPEKSSAEDLAKLKQPSAVKVLKLHGSAGWFRTDEDDGQLYLCYARYLQALRPPWCVREIHDRKEPAPGHGPDENPVVIFPSYIKQLSDPALRVIWGQAARALDEAKKVTFVGYSLPSADVAVRALINPLRRKLLDHEAEVRVVNPDPTHLETWKEFLGNGVECVPKTAKEFFSQET